MAKTLTEVAQEQSSYVVTASFKDEDGESVVPNELNWSLKDERGTTINNKGSVSITPAGTVNVVLTGDDLVLFDYEEKRAGNAKRYFYLWGTYDSSLGTALKITGEALFEVENFKSI